MMFSNSNEKQSSGEMRNGKVWCSKPFHVFPKIKDRSVSFQKVTKETEKTEKTQQPARMFPQIQNVLSKL